MEPEDIKERYKDDGGPEKLRAYSRSVEGERNVTISITFKSKGIVELAISRCSSHAILEEVKRDIMEEMCTVSAF